jgi:hypothetical protein
MKELFILGVTAALLMGGISSCKKTSNRKMSNEWAVSTLKSSSTTTDSDGGTSVKDISLDNNIIKEKIVHTSDLGNYTIEREGSVVEFTYTINKDGSWESVNHVDWINGSGSVISTKVTTSGIWNLIGKNKSKDLKANERVLFNTLSQDISNVTTITVDGVSESSSTSSKNVYAAGENFMTYLIVESKSKELELSKEFDQIRTFTSVSGEVYITSSKGTETLKLEQK